MKMPTKAELLRLQRTYRTDKKIAEALGGIPEYLVAYWRRKKGLPKPNLPKYSESQVRELWERFGDDFRCGRELGISKAAFYSWRRFYNIREKPQALKLEQLELRFGFETKLGRNGVYVEYYQTAFQKILAKAHGNKTAKPDEIVKLSPDLLILPIQMYRPGLDPKIENKCRWVKPSGPSLAPSVPVNAAHLMDTSFDALIRGAVRSNLLIVTSFERLHALGAFSSAVITLPPHLAQTALAQEVDYKVPHFVRVNVSGRLAKGLAVVDLIAFFIEKLGAEAILGRVIEFSGTGVERLNGDEKMALCYFTRLAGAEAAYCPLDESTRRFMAQYMKVDNKTFFSDRTAHYDAEYLLNTVGLESYCFVDSEFRYPKTARSVGALKPDLMFLGGPCGGSAGAIKAAAESCKDRRANPRAACFISPSTHADLSEGLRRKTLTSLVEFGCQLLPIGMSLADFLRMAQFEGTLVTVPDRSGELKPNQRIVFASAETAVLSAAGRTA